LIVMGVSVRPGEELFFGNTARRVLAEAHKPVLFIASKPAEAQPSQDDKTPKS